MMTKVFKLLATFLILASFTAYCDDDSEFKALEEARQFYGVYKFTSPDFPAMFAIIGGMSLLLVVGVVFITVGLLTMEPAKDSIIYRMTTTRMKKD